jgi:hypothetical protein
LEIRRKTCQQNKEKGVLSVYVLKLVGKLTGRIWQVQFAKGKLPASK